MRQVFVGLDWAEDHHDVFVEDDTGKRLGGGRLPEGVDGVAGFHELVAGHVDDPADVVVATETDRGLFIDQSQSLNLFVEAPNMGKLTSMHFHAWKKGLKTGMYYLRTKAASAAIKFTVTKKAEEAPQVEEVATGFSPAAAPVTQAVAEAVAASPVAFAAPAAAVAAAAPVSVTNELPEMQFTPVASAATEYSAQDAITCSLDDPDGCLACGS